MKTADVYWQKQGQVKMREVLGWMAEVLFIVAVTSLFVLGLIDGYFKKKEEFIDRLQAKVKDIPNATTD